jgi:1-acyl-sn-glycerol-3-phosphate acyltransferase
VPVTLVLRPLWPRVEEHFATLTHRALRAYIGHLTFLRLRVEGAEARLDGPRILVANHQSRLDSPVLLALEPRLCGPVRGYMLRVPILGSVIRMMGFFDADAGEAAVLEAIGRAARRAGARGGGLLFYPEGTRSETGEISTFRRGAFRAAVDHDLPIQPVVIEGLDAVLPPGRAITPVRGRHTVRIRYLEPLHPPYGAADAAARRATVRALAEQVRTQLADELARMRAERAGKPVQ